MKTKSKFKILYLYIFFSICIEVFSLESLNKNQMSQFESNLYLKCADSCKVNLKEKNLCEFAGSSERFLLDCYKCDGEGENCNNCYSYNEVCYEMKNDGNFSYQHNTNIYTIQIAKLKSNYHNENKFSADQNDLGIIDVNDLSKTSGNPKNSFKNVKLDADDLTMNFKNFNEELENIDDKEPATTNIKDKEILVTNEKNQLDLKSSQLQLDKKLYGVIVDLSGEASIEYFNSDTKWKKYYESLLENSNVEIITKTSDDPRVIVLKNIENNSFKLNVSYKGSFWIQDCLNYFVVKKKKPEEIIIITSGNPSDEYLYLRAVNLDKVKLILTGIPQRDYLSTFNLKVFKDE